MAQHQKPLLKEVLQAHYQFDGEFCYASGLEFVSKLYGLTPLDAFPLQENDENQHKGFGETDLQDLVSLNGTDAYGDVQSALDSIEKEINSDKSVLVSLRGFLTYGRVLCPQEYHIFVVTPQGNQPILIDPQMTQVLASDSEGVSKILEWNSRKNPDRKGIYTETLHPKNEA